MPWMCVGQVVCEPSSVGVVEFTDDLAGVAVVLWARVLALVQELQMRGEVRDALAGVKDRVRPSDPDRRVASIDPRPVVAFSDRDVQPPWTTVTAATPQIVVVLNGIERVATPRRESTGRRDMEIPTIQDRTQRMDVPASYADIDVIVIPPTATGVQFQRAAAADPPPDRSRTEQVDDYRYIDGLPRTELRRQHASTVRRRSGVSQTRPSAGLIEVSWRHVSSDQTHNSGRLFQ